MTKRSLATRPRKRRPPPGGSEQPHAGAPGKPWVTLHLDGVRVHFPQPNGNTLSVLLNRETALELVLQIVVKLETLKLPGVQGLLLSKLAKWFLEDV